MGECVRILCVEPARGERASLEEIFVQAMPEELPDANWLFQESPTIEAASCALEDGGFALVLCDNQTTTGTWRELIQALLPLSDPPLLIVTSRLADEQLWAEALNLGAHDVLAKPYVRREVAWALGAAWQYRQQRNIRPRTEALHRAVAAG